MTALNTFGASLAPGQFAQFPSPSLAALYDGTAYPFEPSAVARAAALAGGWSAVHMADWWSLIPWDEATDSYWIAGGRDRAQPLAQNLVSYHAATDTWTHRAGWSGASGGHCYQQTAVGDGKAFYVGGTAVQVWDQATEALLSSIPAAPNNVVPGYSSALAAGGAAALVPWLGAAGSMVAVNTNPSSNPLKRLSRIFRWDFALGQYVSVFGAKNVWNNQHTIALKSRHADVMLVGASTNTENLPLGVLDASGTVSFLPPGPMSVCTSGSKRGLVWEHPGRNEWIVGCLNTGRIYSLPPGAPAWIDRQAMPTELMNSNSAVMQTSFGAAFVRYQSAGLSKMYAWKPGF